MAKPYDKKTKLGKFLHRLVDRWRGVRVDIIRAVQAFKLAVESPQSRSITSWIPGEKDDRVVEFLRELLPKVLAGIGLLDKAIGTASAPQRDTATQAALAKLKGIEYNKALRGDMYNRIATAMLVHEMNAKISDADASEKMQAQYDEEKKAGTIA